MADFSTSMRTALCVSICPRRRLITLLRQLRCRIIAFAALIDAQYHLAACSIDCHLFEAMSALSIIYPQQESLEGLGLWRHATATKSVAMEINSSMSENICNEETSFPENDPFVKVRKPYTISKQRERWTEEEHETFLEALKLYGRAWRRIEEKIGTKTAVQIRSHAQKFFSKVERDQSSGGNCIKLGEDIDIPPPRPKRKPTHPYPRKAPPTAPNIGRPQQSTIAITAPECSLLKDSELLNSAMASSTSDQHHLKASGGCLPHHKAYGTGQKLAEGMKRKVDVEPQTKGTIKLFGQTMQVDAPPITCKGAQITSIKSESEIPESVVSINFETADEIESRKCSSRDESGIKPKLVTRSASRGSNLSTLESSISSMDQNEESCPSKTLHKSRSKYNPDTHAFGYMDNEESAQRSNCSAYQLESFPTQAQSHNCSAAFLQDTGALSYGGCYVAAPDHVVASVGEQIHPLAVPLQLWQTMGRQNSAAGLTSHATYWPMMMPNPATATPVSALPALNSSEAVDDQGSVSVTAATIAAASAWWALQGAIPPGVTIVPSMQPSAYIASAPNYSSCSSQFAGRVLEDHDSEKRKIMVNMELNFRSASKDEDSKEHRHIFGDDLNQPREKLQMGPIHPSKRFKTIRTTNHCLPCGSPLTDMEGSTPARCFTSTAADTAYQRSPALAMLSRHEDENFTIPNSVYSQDNEEDAIASTVLKKLSTSGSNSYLLQQYSDTCEGKSVRNLLDLVEGTYDDAPNLSGEVRLSSDRGGPSSNSSACGNSRCSATSFPTSDSGSDDEAEVGNN
ncbi:hypothetical protein O6H91_07G065200 [Diphasiastrum complanatum]|uniref:Uncharacterized protein n=1 Tax=Diphasiastrum complanatum TaxID=34168 RepID=A0ACC2D6D7_DIPCM|nr:hypothetical protein O6H91_07G065200 [Diphasiastrum complanatum]